MEEEKKTEKSNNKTHKKIEHGGEISYHALCCVVEVLENYRNGGEDSQGKFEYSECKEVKKETCPHCGGEEIYAYGYYHRKVSAMGKDGARKRPKIKVKRYKCLNCGRTYTQS